MHMQTKTMYFHGNICMCMHRRTSERLNNKLLAGIPLRRRLGLGLEEVRSHHLETSASGLFGFSPFCTWEVLGLLHKHWISFLLQMKTMSSAP